MKSKNYGISYWTAALTQTNSTKKSKTQLDKNPLTNKIATPTQNSPTLISNTLR